MMSVLSSEVNFKIAANITLAVILLLSLSTTAFSQNGDVTVETEPPPSSRTVLENLKDKSLTYNIRNDINADEGLLQRSHINVTTVNGIVLLTGTVPKAADKEWVEEKSGQYEDVRQVVNELRVSKLRNPLHLAKDVLLQASVKFRLAKELNEYSSLVQVISSHKIIYLMGELSSEIADKAANIARTTKGVERVITIFEISDS